MYVPYKNPVSEDLYFVLQTYTSISSSAICLGCFFSGGMFSYNTEESG